jgi:hypothetical protein
MIYIMLIKTGLLLKKHFDETYGSYNRILTSEDITVFLKDESNGTYNNVSRDDDLKFFGDRSLGVETPSPLKKKKADDLLNASSGNFSDYNSRYQEEDTEEEQQKNRDGIRVGKFFIAVFDDDSVLFFRNEKSGITFYIRLGNKKDSNIMISVTENAENHYIVAGTSGGQTFGRGKLLEWLETTQKHSSILMMT